MAVSYKRFRPESLCEAVALMTESELKVLESVTILNEVKMVG